MWVAPKLDDLITDASRTIETHKDSAKELFEEIFKLTDKIKPMGENNRRTLYFKLPRGKISDFIPNEEYEKDPEECNVHWEADYPDKEKWYKLTTFYDNFFRAITINESYVYQEGDLTQKNRCEVDNTALAKFLIEIIKEILLQVTSGDYNLQISKEIPHNLRKGKIKRTDLWETFPDNKEKYLKNITDEERALFKKIVEANEPPKPLKEMTVNKFLECCKLGYLANNYEGTTTLNTRELYLKYADGRHDGLLDIPANDPEAFAEWALNTKGYGHPWEVVKGGTWTHISLYVDYDSHNHGWNLTLSGSSETCSVETIKFFLTLKKHGISVELCDTEELVKMVHGEDYIGILPMDDASTFPEEDKIITYKHLSQEDIDNLKEKIVWYPLTQAELA